MTDHTGSGLNGGIPCAEAKVCYDDMHDFGKAIRYAKEQDPSGRFCLFKSDITSAFLNLPAHPFWQIRQIVQVDGIFHVVFHLIFRN